MKIQAAFAHKQGLTQNVKKSERRDVSTCLGQSWACFLCKNSVWNYRIHFWIHREFLVGLCFLVACSILLMRCFWGDAFQWGDEVWRITCLSVENKLRKINWIEKSVFNQDGFILNGSYGWCITSFWIVQNSYFYLSYKVKTLQVVRLAQRFSFSTKVCFISCRL